ncbi:MAG TPA: response regulator transcription factor [Bryobacteraceae bacterium]|jgi:two-component system alkaline phosphatase synthesis response regulator PhoP|nr:response regulator transcription factor [Bryobacteraceae bacterium]
MATANMLGPNALSAVKHVLLVEDEEALRLFLGDSLRSEGYAVEHAADGEEGLRKATHFPFDLIILDIMLPRRDGFEVCQMIRATGRGTPILMLTARGQIEDTVKGLKIGADDYVSKPFNMGELMARIGALLRRSSANAPQLSSVYAFGSIRVDLRATEVTRNGKPVQLSAREFQLLRFLIEHPGETLSRDVLLRDVWGYGAKIHTRTVDMRIANLRQQLENDPKEPEFILTVQGLGYKFRAAERETGKA